MNLKQAIAHGVTFWCIRYVVVVALVVYGLYVQGDTSLLPVFAAGAVALIIAAYARLTDYKEALLKGIIWVGVSLIFDLLLTARFAPYIFGMWTLWVGYILVLLAPVILVKKVS